MGIEPTLHCHCRGRFLEPAFSYQAPPDGETPIDLHGRPYERHYMRCRVCGHWFGRHDLDLSCLYSGDYVDATYCGSEGMRKKFEQLMALPCDLSDNYARVKRVTEFAQHLGIEKSGAPRLLDVGAGLGIFPSAMQSQGWLVTAMETDTRTQVHLRTVVGVQTLDRTLEDLNQNAIEPFNIITFNKVLEHVEDPVSMLVVAKALLSRNGFIYIELPDVAANIEGPNREEFFIEHHHVFSPTSVGLLAANAGLSPVRIERLREPSSKFTIISFMVKADTRQQKI
jgi:hypothetical protein